MCMGLMAARVYNRTNITYSWSWKQFQSNKTVNLLFDKFISFVSSRVNWADGWFYCAQYTLYTSLSLTHRTTKIGFPSSNIFTIRRALSFPFAHRHTHIYFIFFLICLFRWSMQIEIIKWKAFWHTFDMAMAIARVCSFMYEILWYLNRRQKWMHWITYVRLRLKENEIWKCGKATECRRWHVCVCGVKAIYLIYLSTKL